MSCSLGGGEELSQRLRAALELSPPLSSEQRLGSHPEPLGGIQLQTDPVCPASHREGPAGDLSVEELR